MQTHFRSDRRSSCALHVHTDDGFHAHSETDVAIDAVEKISEMAPAIVAQYANSVFFGGQIVFPRESWLTKLLHNAFVFSAQQRFYRQGYPFLILPIRA